MPSSGIYCWQQRSERKGQPENMDHINSICLHYSRNYCWGFLDLYFSSLHGFHHIENDIICYIILAITLMKSRFCNTNTKLIKNFNQRNYVKLNGFCIGSVSNTCSILCDTLALIIIWSLSLQLLLLYCWRFIRHIYDTTLN